MKDRDDLFDDKVRELLKKENSEIPEQINKKIDDTLSGLRRKRYNYKKISGICAACIAGVILFGITMPIYAGNIPILGSIFDIYHSKQYENYDKYATDLNITKEYNGVRVTINKVVYDGLSINVAYTVETNEPMTNAPDISEAIIKINNKFTEWFSYNGGVFTNDNTAFIGLLEINLNSGKEIMDVLENGSEKLDENTILTLDIKNLGKIFSEKDTKGKWNFKVPVNSTLVDGDVKEVNCHIDLSNIHKETEVKRVVSTPINISIQGLTTNEFMKSGVDYLLFDDKARQLERKGGIATSVAVSKNKTQGYFNYYYQGAYEDSESLIFIPYKNLDKGGEPIWINTELNLQGETPIRSDNGENYSTITRVESKDNKTNIYYKSNHAVYGAPISIIDNKTGEKTYAIGYEQLMHLDGIKYFKESDEFVITFEKELIHDDYTVEFEDYSKVLSIYNDDMFIIDIK